MKIQTYFVIASLSAAMPNAAPQTVTDRDYWQRAKTLLERTQRGEALSAAEQSFLDEARQRRGREQGGRNPGMQGDGATAPMQWPVAAKVISEQTSPVRPLAIAASDGRKSTIYWRQPNGDGPFPAILFIHGGLDEFPAQSLRAHLTNNPVITRFLAQGYATVMATFRSYSEAIQSRGPILDCSAAVDTAARLPSIDPKRFFVYGGSGGGSIALELAGQASVCAVVACEPATVIYSGMLTTSEYDTRLEMMRDPDRFFTPEIRQQTLAKLKTIRSPVLIVHSDRHDLIKLNKPIMLPLMRETGVSIEYREYPGFGHGFYWGGGGDRWGKAADVAVVESVVADCLQFFTRSESR